MCQGQSLNSHASLRVLRVVKSGTSQKNGWQDQRDLGWVLKDEDGEDVWRGEERESPG